MKHRSPTNANQNVTKRICVAVVLVLSIGGVAAGYLTSLVKADKWDEQIQALQNENRQYAARANELRAYADTLAGEIAQLEAEKATIQGHIDELEAQVQSLRQQIKATEKKIENTREALGEVITEIYLAGQISPLERLASQKSLTEYLDEEAAREELQHELNRKVKEIDAYKKELEKKEKEVESSLKTQNIEKQRLMAKEAEKQSILAETKGNEASYRQLAADNNARINQLRAEQLAYLNSLGGRALPGDPSRGGYPDVWANAPLNAYTDRWGMYSRQCVSYAAWKVHQNYGNMPHWGGIGNAWQWAFSGWAVDEYRYGDYGKQVGADSPRVKKWHTANAEAWGIPWGHTPKVGSVGISNGDYGHAVWVEAVVGDRVIVSEYNYDWAGNHRRANYAASTFRYIYFGEWK